MKIEKKHLELVKNEFEKVRKFKHNVLDYSAQYYGEGLDKVLLLYTVFLFNSYDYCLSKNIHVGETWENFYKLLEDSVGLEQEELGNTLFDKYGFAH